MITSLQVYDTESRLSLNSEEYKLQDKQAIWQLTLNKLWTGTKLKCV